MPEKNKPPEILTSNQAWQAITALYFPDQTEPNQQIQREIVTQLNSLHCGNYQTLSDIAIFINQTIKQGNLSQAVIRIFALHSLIALPDQSSYFDTSQAIGLLDKFEYRTQISLTDRIRPNLPPKNKLFLLESVMQSVSRRIELVKIQKKLVD